MEIPTVCLFNIDGFMIRANVSEKEQWASLGFVYNEEPEPIKPDSIEVVPVVQTEVIQEALPEPIQVSKGKKRGK